MRVLITGDRGFIGEHLKRELSEHGYEVFGHDREDGDLTEPTVFYRALELHDPDHVVHLAAQVGRLFGEQDVLHTINSNATMTALVAKHCGMRGIPVLFASTSEIYGDRGHHVCREGADLTPWAPNPLPHNLYGLSKRWSEEVLRLYAPEGLRIVRLSMPYGPGAPPGQGRRAMDNFLWWAYHRLRLTVHRGSERSWCWIGDTVRGIRLVLEQDRYEIVNVGRDDRPISMLDLARKACAIMGAPESLIQEVDPPAQQTVVKRLSTERLRELGWSPTVELDEGMAAVGEWVKNFDQDGNWIKVAA